jgi:hypothetical protein
MWISNFPLQIVTCLYAECCPLHDFKIWLRVCSIPHDHVKPLFASPLFISEGGPHDRYFLLTAIFCKQMCIPSFLSIQFGQFQSHFAIFNLSLKLLRILENSLTIRRWVSGVLATIGHKWFSGTRPIAVILPLWNYSYSVCQVTKNVELY